VVGVSLAVVADDLETANHLAHGKKSQQLSSENATSYELGCGDIARLLQQRGRVRRCLLHGLQQGTRVLQLLPDALEIRLEGRHGPG
jgi:hypothetical protein